MSKILYFGICLAGLMAGLMVGLSSSPVVGAALPALVAAFAGGVAIFFRNPLDPQVSEVLKAWNAEEQAGKENAPRDIAVKGEKDHKDIKQEAILKELRALEKRRRALPSRLGWALTLFLAVYFGGLLLGSEWRSYASQAPKSSVPPGLAAALDKARSIKEAWMQIYYYRNFVTQGLQDETIAKILTLPEEESPHPSIINPDLVPPIAETNSVLGDFLHSSGVPNKGPNPASKGTPGEAEAKGTPLPPLPTPTPRVSTVAEIPPLPDPNMKNPWVGS